MRNKYVKQRGGCIGGSPSCQGPRLEDGCGLKFYNRSALLRHLGLTDKEQKELGLIADKSGVKVSEQEVPRWEGFNDSTQGGREEPEDLKDAGMEEG